MPHYVGLDVSQKTTAICVVDAQGKRLWRGVCATDPGPISARISQHAGVDAKVGIETGSMTPWLVHGLRAAGLDNADVGAGFEQMSSEAVAQGVDGDRLIELGCCPRGAAGGLQYARIERPAVVLAGKEPMCRPCFPPVGAQYDEEMRRQHDIAVAAALALINPDQHATAVDIGEFQTHYFRYAQPGRIGGHQRGAMLEVRHGREKLHHLLGTQDYRQLPALACIGNALDHCGAAERDAVEEAQGADRDVEAGP